MRIVVSDNAGGDLPIDIRPITLTSEFVHYIVRILGAPDDVTALIDWVCEHIESRSNPRDLLMLVGEDGIAKIATAIASNATMPEDVLAGAKQMWTLVYGADEYDPTMSPICECMACTGGAEHDPRCLFLFDRPQVSDLISSLDWDTVAECWDLPWYVYQARVEQQRAKDKGEAVGYQERRREAENKAAAADIRKKRFGTDNWHDIAKQRGA